MNPVNRYPPVCPRPGGVLPAPRPEAGRVHSRSPAVAGVPSRDRRRAYRHRCTPAVLCRLVIVRVEDRWATRVVNLSPGGARVLVDGPLPADKPVVAVLYGPGEVFSCCRPARVDYAAANGPKQVVAGLAFAPGLTRPELDGLLQLGR